MISAVIWQLWCVGGLLAVSVVAIALSRAKVSTATVYGATLVICIVALFGPVRSLIAADAANVPGLTLPIGLPWLGAHFQIDALAAFFLLVVNLRGAAASLFGLGYGHHDRRRTAFFPSSLSFWQG
jgi:formate hydrogenlyase subunit 3/multisubunit Na+/H+ antiporter MnhD subunit